MTKQAPRRLTLACCLTALTYALTACKGDDRGTDTSTAPPSEDPPSEDLPTVDAAVPDSAQPQTADDNNGSADATDDITDDSKQPSMDEPDSDEPAGDDRIGDEADEPGPNESNTDEPSTDDDTDPTTADDGTIDDTPAADESDPGTDEPLDAGATMPTGAEQLPDASVPEADPVTFEAPLAVDEDADLPGVWSPYVQIAQSVSNILDLDLEIDANGNAAITWRQYDDTAFEQSNTYVAEYAATTETWTPQRRLNDLPDSSYYAVLEFDPLGNALAAWMQIDDDDRHLMSSYRRVGGSWSTPVSLEALDDDAHVPELVFTADGRALAVWVQDASESSLLHASWADTTQQALSWSAPQPIGELAGRVWRVRTAAEVDGNVTVVFDHYDEQTDTSSMRATRYDAQSQQWSASQVIGQPAIETRLVGLDTDSQGNALVLWASNVNDVASVHSQVYLTTTASWTEPRWVGGISGPTQLIIFTELAMGSGAGVFAWGQGPGSGQELYATRVSLGQSAAQGGLWTTPELLAGASIYNLRVATASSADAVLAWKQRDTSGENVYVRHLLGETWGPAAGPAVPEDGTVDDLVIALSEDGSAVLVVVLDEPDGDRLYASVLSPL